MSQVSLARIVVVPSFLSGFTTILTALVVVGISAWTYISGNQLFYEYLFGTFGIVTVLVQAPDVFAVFRAEVINSSITYGIAIFVCAVLIGMLVYTLLEGFSRVSRETSVLWYEFHVHTPAARQAVRESLTRLAIRSFSFVAWVVYLLLFINVLLPFCLLLLQTGLDQLELSVFYGLALCLLATLFLITSLHLHIIFIRLYFLRPRLLGGYTLERTTLEGK